MTPSREQVLEALKRVPEPCSLAMGSATDIVGMGLVEDVRIAAGRVRIELVLADPSCVHFASIRRYVGDVLLPLTGVESVEVAISTTELWTPDRVRA